MFIKAIQKVEQYTRPLHTIAKSYSGLITPGAGTLFFVNEDAVAITCKHVLNIITQADQINAQYNDFKNERSKIKQDDYYQLNVKNLETKFNYRDETIVQIKHQFVNTVDQLRQIKCIPHPTLDLAIVKFEGFQRTHYNSYATFVKDPNKIKQGKSLCRLGYPFPEFNNFRHNPATDDIEWTTVGNRNTPTFPLDGIITRFVNGDNRLMSIEMSTPGLRGQSGGPLFDSDGLVYGMQFKTSHHHLGFDMDEVEIVKNGIKTKVSNYPFLHVGHSVHVERITEFLKQHDIKFYEE